MILLRLSLKVACLSILFLWPDYFNQVNRQSDAFYSYIVFKLSFILT